MDDKKYKLSISLNILRHLGIGLYSNIPAVLSEVIANSWDADAKTVEIDIDIEKREITITDDGFGMSHKDMNDKYLKVGYRKREEGMRETPKKRKVMGRKGIGKLSLFSIANIIEVHSVKENEEGIKEKSGFVMDAKEIEKKIEEEKKSEEQEVDYKPIAIDEGKININKGTKILLRDLKIEPDKIQALKKKIARRFSIISEAEKFYVFVNGEKISIADRDYFNKLEYMWYLGAESKKYVEYSKSITESHKLEDIIDDERNYKISGWIGTVEEHKSLEEGNNTIVVLSRGKLVHEDILKDLKEGGIFTKYLIGEIDVDFFDLDDQEDITTSGRQSVKEEDDRYELLKHYIKDQLRIISNDWDTWRKKHATKKATENPKVRAWYESLGPDNKEYAEKLFVMLEKIPVPDKEFKRDLYKHGIIAFETLKLKNDLSLLEQIETKGEFDQMKAIIGNIDSLEQVYYYQMVSGRLGVLKKFIEIVDANSKEKIIRDHIYDHLWLLDTSWERASTEKRMEQTFIKEFKKVKLKPKEKAARTDIRYRTAAGKHIIIELKRYSEKININDLVKQVQKYKMILQKCLKKCYPDNYEQEDFEIICILGSNPAPVSDDIANKNVLKAHRARYVTYDGLIEDTTKRYEEWLNKEKELQHILDIVNNI